MSEHLLINPDLLYRLYPHTLVKDYYEFTFLPDYNSIEIYIFYDILNCLSLRQLKNFDQYLFKQWSLTKYILKESDITSKRKDKSITINYSCNLIEARYDINSKLTQFINGDKINALFIMNKILKFLYPC